MVFWVFHSTDFLLFLVRNMIFTFRRQFYLPGVERVNHLVIQNLVTGVPQIMYTKDSHNNRILIRETASTELHF